MESTGRTESSAHHQERGTDPTDGTTRESADGLPVPPDNTETLDDVKRRLEKRIDALDDT